jgi:hypothetical protein
LKRLSEAYRCGIKSTSTSLMRDEMAIVGAGDVAVGGVVTIVSYAATLFLARGIHKAITKGKGREDKPRWMAANGAGIAFVMTGLVWSPKISFKIAQVVTGSGGAAFEVALLVFMMVFWTVIGGLIGFGIGKVRS